MSAEELMNLVTNTIIFGEWTKLQPVIPCVGNAGVVCTSPKEVKALDKK